MEIFTKDEITELFTDALDTVYENYVKTGELTKPEDILAEVKFHADHMLDALEEEKDRDYKDTVERLNEQLKAEQELVTGE